MNVTNKQLINDDKMLSCRAGEPGTSFTNNPDVLFNPCHEIALKANSFCSLVHSEVSEAMEGHRKNLMDDKLPHRSMLEVELADAVIRIMDMCGRLGLDLGGAIEEKLEYNRTREDHSIKHRLSENGKKF